MKNLKKLSAIALSTLFATMQISVASIDTGLGGGLGGAVIDSHSGGLQNVVPGTNQVDLNFNANTHVKWDSLNLNSNETMNFNTVGTANNLTILNTVNNNMSRIYGRVNADSGIGKLIISNPNGVLFDGAKFTTAGDTMITTKDMSNVNVNNITDGTYTKLKSDDWGTNGTPDLIQVQIKDSNFSVGGDFNIFAPKITGVNSAVKANTLKLVTANGADYIAAGLASPVANKAVTRLTAMDINGDVVITNDVGAFAVEDGGSIKGNLTSETGGWVRINETSNGKTFTVDGDMDTKGHGEQLMVRHSYVTGNANMSNDGGFVDIGNVTVDGDAKLTTTGIEPIYSNKFNHYVHVIGDTNIGGNLDIDASQNIHIGNYKITNNAAPYQGYLLSGKLTVGGDINAKTTAGHIMTTIDTEAKNINYEARKGVDSTRSYGGNILSDGKAVIKADTYQFKSAGYIGGIKGTTNTTDNTVIDIMENYTHIPADIPSNHDYLTIDGGTITKLETPKLSPGGNNVQVYIKSKNDLLVNGANASDINLVAPGKKITITGDVQANNINVGPETDYLKLDYPNRKFTTNFTSIRDDKVVTIKPDEEITYELADGGYNQPTLQPGEKTTYLYGPDKTPGPVPPPTPTPDPPTPPDPTPDQPIKPTDDDNVRVKNWVPEDPMKPLVNTPVAFAADLDDDDIEGPIRKNVDGSVTVVRAYPMNN